MLCASIVPHPAYRSLSIAAAHSPGVSMTPLYAREKKKIKKTTKIVSTFINCLIYNTVTIWQIAKFFIVLQFRIACPYCKHSRKKDKKNKKKQKKWYSSFVTRMASFLLNSRNALWKSTAFHFRLMLRELWFTTTDKKTNTCNEYNTHIWTHNSICT